MRIIYIIVIGLALSGWALAQSRNAVKTGAGGQLDTLEVLQAEISKYSDGQLGRAFKGATGLTGVAAALSAASDAVNFRVRADGTVVPGGSSSGSSSGSGGTSAVTSSSSTN